MEAWCGPGLEASVRTPAGEPVMRSKNGWRASPYPLMMPVAAMMARKRAEKKPAEWCRSNENRRNDASVFTRRRFKGHQRIIPEML